MLEENKKVIEKIRKKIERKREELEEDKSYQYKKLRRELESKIGELCKKLLSNEEKGIKEERVAFYPSFLSPSNYLSEEILKKPEEILDKIKNIEEEETLLKFREFELDIIEEYLEEHEKYEHLSVDKVLIIKRIYEDDDID